MVTYSEPYRFSSTLHNENWQQNNNSIICRSTSCCHVFVVTSAVVIYIKTMRTIQPHEHSNNTSCSILFIFVDDLYNNNSNSHSSVCYNRIYVCLTVLLSYLRSFRVSFLLLSILARKIYLHIMTMPFRLSVYLYM